MRQVPDASMTALASTCSSPPSGHWIRSTNGASCRPGVFILSWPRRAIAVTRAQADVRRDLRQRCQRLEIALDDVAPGRGPSGIGQRPPGRLEQGYRRGIDGVLPGREEAHVAPLADRRADGVASLEDERRLAAGEQVGGRGQADRASADDGDRAGLRGGRDELAVDEKLVTMVRKPREAGSSAAGEAVDQPLERVDDGRLVQAVVDLAALLAGADQAAALEDQQVVGDGRPAEGDARGDVADVEFLPREQLDQVLAGRVGQRVEQVAAGDQVVAQLPDLGAEGIWRHQAADVLIAD